MMRALRTSATVTAGFSSTSDDTRRRHHDNTTHNRGTHGKLQASHEYLPRQVLIVEPRSKLSEKTDVSNRLSEIGPSGLLKSAPFCW